jgi:hypothetical protein
VKKEIKHPKAGNLREFISSFVPATAIESGINRIFLNSSTGKPVVSCKEEKTLQK